MIRIGILGNIGSGKSYVANNLGYPVFDADYEVAMLYKKNRKIFLKLKKKLPDNIKTFPIEKKEIIKAILQKKNNLKKIINIVHTEIRKKMNLFLKKNKNKKFVVLDVPLLLENKLNKKGDILIFIDSKKSDILKKLTKRKNFNKKLFNKFQKIQFSSQYKIRRSNFIIKNDFTKKTININIKDIQKKINL
ncbi:dephospho-CoA kinase [Candidatus Pelagibacter sp.]|uniref:dephospho-CoA kinase n=1 Tax=Candidatus Pelagibacter sp. TaxID=2024849 RepID=UPI003F86ABF2